MFDIKKTNILLAMAAAGAGYADQAHMTHAVARLTGATPGWWRRRQMDTRQR